MIHWNRASILARLIVCGAAASAALVACSSSSPKKGTEGTGGAGGASPTGTGGSDDAGGPDASDDDAGKDAGPDNCDVLCGTESMVCSKTSLAGCKAACEEEKYAVIWCFAEAKAADDCLAMQPASSFMCDTKGQAQPNTGVCSTELTALTTCWDKGPPKGLPDLTSDCTKACAAEASLSCADPNCTTTCETTVKGSSKCVGAFAAVVACSATQTSADFQCSTAKTPRPTLKSGHCTFQSLLLAECLK